VRVEVAAQRDHFVGQGLDVLRDADGGIELVYTDYSQQKSAPH